jgi:hypothetical protein
MRKLIDGLRDPQRRSRLFGLIATTPQPVEIPLRSLLPDLLN